MLPQCREHRDPLVFSLEMCKWCYQGAGAQVRSHLLKTLFWSFGLVLLVGVKRRQEWFTPGMMLCFCPMVQPVAATLPLAPGDVAIGSPQKGRKRSFRGLSGGFWCIPVLQECSDRCCNATTCQLREGAECARGDCCQDCKVLPLPWGTKLVREASCWVHSPAPGSLELPGRGRMCP